MSKEKKCGKTVGTRPWWMGDGQWDSTKCGCIQPRGHDGECWCVHTRPAHDGSIA